jgi:hypothetical protein
MTGSSDNRAGNNSSYNGTSLNDNGFDDNAEGVKDTILNEQRNDDGSGLGSGGLFLVVLSFGIILNPFCSHTFLLIGLNDTEGMDKNGGLDSSGHEITGGANNADVVEEINIEGGADGNARGKGSGGTLYCVLLWYDFAFILF